MERQNEINELNDRLVEELRKTRADFKDEVTKLRGELVKHRRWTKIWTSAIGLVLAGVVVKLSGFTFGV